MKFDLESGIAVLERTPPTLDALLRGLPEAWVRATEGPDTWSPYDVLGHLIHGEKTDWIPRVRMILQQGERQAFVPFDRFAQFRDSRGKSLETLLDEFAALRSASLEALRGLDLTPARLQLRGRHPELGAATLGELLAAWVAHDLDHVYQISRVMAKQYRDAVGPWAAYLRVVRE